MCERAGVVPAAGRSGEEGQTSVEYAAVLLLVAIVLAGALALGLTGLLDAAISSITNKL